MKVLSVMCVILGLSLFGRSTVSKRDWQKTTKIVYIHSDGTITPELFRSYAITITATDVVVDIRDYDRQLLSKRYSNSERNFLVLKSQLQRMDIAKVREKDITSGGSTESLRLYMADKEFFSAYSSGGYGTLSVKSGSLGETMRKLVPNIDDMVEQTRPQH